ncbi:MAG TPA: phospholipase D-like domain-containing protein [Bacillota bacterium]|nr:phospholipase D-like domain-containing protein [Bacillota bacterium]
MLSHKEITNKIIQRYKEAQNGGRPFDVQILVSPDILEEFPYCRNAFEAMEAADVPIRVFNVYKPIDQRLHCKLAIFDNKEVLIGSANWSAVGLEQNLEKGLRPDYPLTNDTIDEDILEYKPPITSLERELGFEPLFKNGNYDYQKMMERKRALRSALQRVNNAIKENKEPENIVITDKNDSEKIITLEPTNENLSKMKKLARYYAHVQSLENRRERFKRGNNECAIVFSSPKIANTFLRQFKKDWDYSQSSDTDEISFTGNRLRQLAKAKEPRFDQIV